MKILPNSRFASREKPLETGTNKLGSRSCISEVSLSIVIPAYNEEHRLPQTLGTLAEYICSRPWKFIEVIIVDDGSSDRTAGVVTEATHHHHWLRLITYQPNRGKGGAVREGMLQSTGDWRLLCDADLSAPIEEVEKLLKVAHDRGSEIVIASRALDRSLIERHQSASREYAGRIFNLFVQLLTGLRLFDTQCGFKLFSTRSAERVFALQRLDGFGFDVEVLFLGSRLGFRIDEVPARWSHMDGTKVSMLRDSVRMFVDLVRIRYNWIRGSYQGGPGDSATPSR